jgi:hypothetical protein
MTSTRPLLSSTSSLIQQAPSVVKVQLPSGFLERTTPVSPQLTYYFRIPSGSTLALMSMLAVSGPVSLNLSMVALAIGGSPVAAEFSPRPGTQTILGCCPIQAGGLEERTGGSTRNSERATPVLVRDAR